MQGKHAPPMGVGEAVPYSEIKELVRKQVSDLPWRYDTYAHTPIGTWPEHLRDELLYDNGLIAIPQSANRNLYARLKPIGDSPIWVRLLQDMYLNKSAYPKGSIFPVVMVKPTLHGISQFVVDVPAAKHGRGCLWPGECEILLDADNVKKLLHKQSLLIKPPRMLDIT